MMLRIVRKPLVFLPIFLSHHANGADGDNTVCKFTSEWSYNSHLYDKDAFCSEDENTRLFFYGPTCQLGMRTCNEDGEKCEVIYLKNQGKSPTGCNSAVLQRRSDAGNLFVAKSGNSALELKDTDGNFGVFTPQHSKDQYNDIATMTINNDGTFETIVTNKGNKDPNFSEVVWRAGRARGGDGEDTTCIEYGQWRSGTSLYNNQAICSNDRSTRIYFIAKPCVLGMRTCFGNRCNSEILKNPDDTPRDCTQATLQDGRNRDAGNIVVSSSRGTELQLAKKINGEFGSAFRYESSNDPNNDIATMTVGTDSFQTLVTNSRYSSFSRVVWSAGGNQPPVVPKCQDVDENWCYNRLRGNYYKGFSCIAEGIQDRCAKSCYTCNHMAPRDSCYDDPSNELPRDISSCRNLNYLTCFDRIWSGNEQFLKRDFCRKSCYVDANCFSLSDVALRGAKQE